MAPFLATPRSEQIQRHCFPVHATDGMKTTFFRRPAIGTAILLAIPLVMTILDRNKSDGEGWHWRPAGFLVMGALLFGAGVFYEWLASKIARPSYRAVFGVGVFLTVVAIWSELAVDAVSRSLQRLVG